ncbi:uncharacterized protein LOC141620007 [Silene latifolia]|uniref:uncharacterized protein LOC141620007 n=1 Tax=Silene latifolia TaxID=37657 RepID=UPI003D77D9E3
MALNPYTQFFRSVRDVGIDEESRIVIKSNPMHDQITHNALTESQVAAIWIDDEDLSEPPRHDIAIYANYGTSHRILHYYGCYDPLQYPLLFTFGETRWHRRIYRVSSNPRRSPDPPTFPINEVLIQTAEDLLDNEEQVAGTSESKKKVSCREYYCYRLLIRPTNSSILLRSGQLLQHYAAGQTRGGNIGTCFILPASFIGCDRDFRRRYLCSMTVVQRYGKPDIFLTITRNPRWPEIERELSPFEESHNRPDLLSRIFRSKLIKLKKDICVRKIFDNVAGYVYVVEFQKRGLPHAHFLIILDSDSKIRTPVQYDEFVSAELPDAVENPHLFSAVVRHMIHGPCGEDNPTNSCMKNVHCKNHYPREFADTTTYGRNSYPMYWRWRTGFRVTVRGSQLNNRWVVPYNPFLLAKYDCHLNVEICSTIKAVKYMYKYVYKGHDRVSFAVTDPRERSSFDEITAYQSARWISPPESAWRIFGFQMNEIHPNVVPLQTLLYNQLPEFYVWHNRRKDKFWTRREKGFALGRLVYANPSEGERYYLRLLLSRIHGPKSFEDLRSVNGVLCGSFRESAYKHGLLEADNSIEHCLEEATRYQMPSAFRRLFATLLIYCEPKNPRLMWDKYYDSLLEDYAYNFPTQQHKLLQIFVAYLNQWERVPIPLILAI